MECGNLRRARGGPVDVEIPLRSAVHWGRYIFGIATILVGAWLFIVGGGGHKEIFPESVERHLSGSGGEHVLSTETCGKDLGANHSLDSTLSFLFVCFLICTVMDHLNLLIPVFWRFPITVMMFLMGKIVGAVFLNVFSDDVGSHAFENLVDGIKGAAWFDPHALLYIILPPLLYESASSLNWHVLRKVLPSCIILAVPGVILNTLLTGLFVMGVFRIKGEAPSIEASLLLAAILSATDPVAVVATLSALGAPAKLSTLVEGESLLNDGSAVVAAYVFRDWVMGSEAPSDMKFCTTDPPTGGCILHYFCHVSFGGAAIGVAAGIILYFWLQLARSRHSVLLEMSLVLLAVYGSFFLAESLHISGVLAVVALGIVMTANVKARLSHDGRHSHHTILAQIGYMCNQVIFFAAGIISARFMWIKSPCSHDFTHGRAWLELVLLYIWIHITRLGVVALFWPLLRRLGYGITWKEGVVMVYGGLRGAVGLVMGLIIEDNAYIDPGLKQMIAFHVSGIVVLTLFINGSTVDELYKWLELYPDNPFRITHLRNVLQRLEGDCQKKGIKHIASDWFFHDAILKKILRCVPSFFHIQFDAAGNPQPVYIDPVPDALHALEDDANAFRALHIKSDFKAGFLERWQMRKAQSKERFMDLIATCSGHSDKKDQLVKVSTSSSNSLEYILTDKGRGIYVSACPLDVILNNDAVGNESETDACFQIRIGKTEQVHVLVGFLADAGDVRRIATTGEEQLLGVAANSVGLNCGEGTIFYSGPRGSGQAAALPVGPGATVKLRVSRHTGSEWEVTFSIEGVEDSERSVSFGPFPPSELYPAVEFRPASDRLVNSKPPSGSLPAALPLQRVWRRVALPWSWRAPRPWWVLAPEWWALALER